jgi:hypothetical protein
MQNEDLKNILQGMHDSGGLTPQRMVGTARDPEHPLHPEFEWDDEVAGENYRLVQARKLIRRVKIVYRIDDLGRNVSVRAFVNVPTTHGLHRVYEPTEQVVLDPLKRRLILQEARRDWARFKAKYRHLDEFAEIINEQDRQTG